MARLLLNTELITLNQYINIERGNKFGAASVKKRLTNKVSFLAAKSKFKVEPDVKHDIVVTWFKPDNRTDHDNISFAVKFVLDGLIKAGILQNDSPKYIGSIIHHFELDRTRSYISCEIEFIPSLKLER
jgi:Holliday junction resolvase RusA-like endonuclease